MTGSDFSSPCCNTAKKQYILVDNWWWKKPIILMGLTPAKFSQNPLVAARDRGI
jgi:hypothetical protein